MFNIFISRFVLSLIETSQTSSPKFISAEGGIRRIVWMPKQLKEEVEERLRKLLDTMGCPELFDKIATEENAEDPETLMEYLQSVNHPVFEMSDLF